MNYPRYEIFKDVAGQFRFRLKSKNYEIILTASEGYRDKNDCKRAIAICQQNSQHESNYDRRSTVNGKYYFTLRAINYKDIGRSEDYNTAYARDEGMKDVKRDGPTANVVDLS
jgi:uncharacterized protein